MTERGIKCLVVSDFNSANFVSLLNNDASSPCLEAASGPYGQVAQVLADGGSDCWRNPHDAVIVWTQPGSVIGGFRRLQEGEPVDLQALLQEVDVFAGLVEQAAGRTKSLFVMTWAVPAYSRAFGLLEMRTGIGAANTLARMNLRLIEDLERVRGIHFLDSAKWLATVGAGGFSDKLWYMAKVPFANEVFTEAVKDLKSALNALQGRARKLIVLDLDDTLWGGIVGDLGWENLALGGHDPAGEAFVDFQRALKSLARRGILLAIVSKNEEKLALEAIRKHPEMILREKDFAGWRINWNDKAQNLVDLVSELGLGLQSAVFIDDNPAERARIRGALPEVLVPEWPQDKTGYTRALLGLDCFNSALVTEEDLQRTALYRSERQRSELRRNIGSVDNWLRSLEQVVTVAPLAPANLPRAAQLLNKTNQMNLSTRRMTDVEAMTWSEAPNRRFMVLSVFDRFGDSGLTGLLGMEEAGDRLEVVDFVLSCRVMGRRVEEAMVHLAVEHARKRGCRIVSLRYKATERNKPCLEFLKRSGLREAPEGVFTWDAGRDYAMPEAVRVVDAAAS